MDATNETQDITANAVAAAAVAAVNNTTTESETSVPEASVSEAPVEDKNTSDETIDPAFTEGQDNAAPNTETTEKLVEEDKGTAAVETSESASVETNETVTNNDTRTTGDRQRRRIDASDDDDNEEDREDALDEHVMRHNGPGSNTYNGEVDADDRPMSSRQVLEEKLDMLLKKPKVRRSRRDEDDLEQYLDEKILRLKDEMNIAAQMDIDTLNKRIETGDTSLIAIQKVKLLPKVESTLSKANLADTILDNNLLQSVRIWLEPLPDGSLPSFEIQKSLFAAISDLPIKTEHLKESGLGRVVIFYTKSKRVEPQLARLADRLIAEWTRPIIGASDNYRDKQVTRLDFDSEKYRKKEALDSAKRKKRKVNGSVKNEGSTAQSLYEQAAARRGRAAAPAQTTTDYKYAPVSNVIPMDTDARKTGVGSTLNNSDLYKRLNSRLNNKKK